MATTVATKRPDRELQESVTHIGRQLGWCIPSSSIAKKFEVAKIGLVSAFDPSGPQGDEGDANPASLIGSTSAFLAGA